MEEEPSEIAFSNLDQMINTHIDSTFEEIKPVAIKFKDKFQIIINSIKTLGEQLNEVEINEDDVAQQYLPVINDAKSTIITAIHRETSDQLQEINTFEDILALRDRAMSLLNRLGETGGSHRKTINSFFGKHAKVLKVELGLLDKEIRRLNELLDSYTKKTSSLIDCRESISSISSARNIETQIVEKQIEIREELESLKTKESELSKKIEDFENTEEFNVYIKSKEELTSVMNAVSNVLSDVNTSFSRISRPLSKYTYEVGLDKESDYLMQSIMENPVNMMYDSKADHVIEVLNKVREGMQKGRITTKNPEKDVENINGLIDNLHNYVKRYKEHDSLSRELQGKIAVVKNKLEPMHDELKMIRDDINQKESYLNDYSREMGNARSTVNLELNKISEVMERVLGGKVRIIL